MGEDPIWEPDEETVEAANLTRAIRDRGVGSYEDFHAWSVTDRAGFWEDVIARLGIVFRKAPDRIIGAPDDVEAPGWLDGARLNIAESCFAGDLHATAVVYSDHSGMHRMTLGELRTDVMQAAAGLQALGVAPGDRVAIAMQMNTQAVTAYLACVWAGAVVVSIADSFSPEEIATRMRISEASLAITQDVTRWGDAEHPMYTKVAKAGVGKAIVVETGAGLPLREGDVSWDGMLGAGDSVDPVVSDATAFTNVLFSSGTTGDPKAIPWSQIEPIKASMDGHFHQDVQPGDVVAWPTNLGWMMGPWLIYAPLINGAALALYEGAPMEEGFGRFVEEAGVTILGVVPSLVASWRASRLMEGNDWSAVRLISTTGEASNPSDISYLSGLVDGAPIIEYCGGTELSGGYISGTVLQASYPSQFTTPSLGLDFVILDEEGDPADSGELFIVPPSIGLSETLLNRDHHDVYYAGTPTHDGVRLRRHGDHIERLPNGNYRAHGRVDDTMNLGGIKVSSGELERVVLTVDGAAEAAAVAVEPAGGGPSRLVVYVVPERGAGGGPAEMRGLMQAEVRAHLNPLFKIHDVVFIDALPRTATNKVMRRLLRTEYGGS